MKYRAKTGVVYNEEEKGGRVTNYCGANIQDQDMDL